jgi:hypothetical protein
LGVERFRVPEVLLQPPLAGLDEAGLPELVESCLGRLSAQERAACIAGGLLLVGGGSGFPGERVARRGVAWGRRYCESQRVVERLLGAAGAYGRILGLAVRDSNSQKLAAGMATLFSSTPCAHTRLLFAVRFDALTLARPPISIV